jgi:two-component sensor histidine kinase
MAEPHDAEASAAAARRNDPSRATRAELATRAAESVALVGSLASLVGKAASSPALQSAVASFVEYEATIEATHDMLRKVQQSLVDVEEVYDDVEASVRAARVGTAGPSSTLHGP